MNAKGDNLLREFLSAADAAKAERAFGSLMAEIVDVIVSRTLRSKFGVASGDRDSATSVEALELAADIRVRLVDELTKWRSQGRKNGIENFGAYVTATTLNSYNQHLRAKYPLRNRLRNQIRYLLTHKPGLALWDENGVPVCAREADSPRKPLPTQECETIIDDLKKIGFNETSKLTNVVVAALTTAARPILLGDLVAIAADVMNVHDRREISSDELVADPFESPGNDPVSRIEFEDTLRRVWIEIKEMPLRHRRALLLNLKDRSGDCVVTLLPILKLASIRQIADVLGFEPEYFAAVWNELPWDDLRIADNLGITRQQVINLRQSARSRLARRARERSK